MIETKITPEGTGYMVDYVGADKPHMFYLHGDGQSGNGTTDLVKIKSVAFFKDLYQKNVGKFNFFFPQYPATSHGWADRGVIFINRMLAEYAYYNKNFFTSGHSAGAGGVMYHLCSANDNNYQMPTAAHVVAGGADYKPVMRLKDSGKCPPIRLSVGSKDYTITSQDGKTIYQKMDSIYTWLNKVPQWIEYPGVGHGSDVNAYSVGDGLVSWFLSKMVVTEPPVPVPPLPVDLKSIQISLDSSGLKATGLGSDGSAYTWPVTKI